MLFYSLRLSDYVLGAMLMDVTVHRSTPKHAKCIIFCDDSDEEWMVISLFRPMFRDVEFYTNRNFLLLCRK